MLEENLKVYSYNSIHVVTHLFTMYIPPTELQASSVQMLELKIYSYSSLFYIPLTTKNMISYYVECNSGFVCTFFLYHQQLFSLYSYSYSHHMSSIYYTHKSWEANSELTIATEVGETILLWISLCVLLLLLTMQHHTSIELRMRFTHCFCLFFFYNNSAYAWM